ncbi:GGDEF domain-containing protein [Demequina capsici]|uniref:Diguanylate cyclase n=1 Tax=Demequina capsici TaxID=3075620 RepID=A0AA96F5T2_9MICO|nr:diguanylate cyclase [Demequina sp. OYTSA14]WNM23312.1 diguanylate cyclase [Demequina sp. OYTSA14]
MSLSPVRLPADSRRFLRFGAAVVCVVLAAQVGLALWLFGISKDGAGAAVDAVLTMQAGSAQSWVADYASAATGATSGVAAWMDGAGAPAAQLEDHLLLVVATHEQLHALVVVNADGSWIRVERDAGYGTVRYRVERVTMTGGEAAAVSETYDSSLSSMADSSAAPGPDAGLDAGGPDSGPGGADQFGDGTAYSFWPAGATADALVWTMAVATTPEEGSGVWAAQPVRDAQGALVAVVATEFPVSAMQAVLEAVPLGDSGQVFLMDDARRVIAAPRAFDDKVGAVGGGAPPTLETLGVDTTVEGSSGDSTVSLGHDGVYRTAEVGLAGEGVPWVLHLRAIDAELAPQVLAVGVAIRWAAGISAVVLLVAGVLLFVMWRPMKDMRRAAETDGLTGLLQRRRFLELAPAVVASAHRDGGAACVAVLDLDNFKRLNDDEGHEAGDVALRKVSKAMRLCVRRGDLVARWGGDEFVVLLALADPSDAVSAVERLRQAVEARLGEEFPGRPGLGVTAGGVVSRDLHDDVADLVRSADAALVEGKRRQKSRSYVAEGLPAPA